MQSPKGIGFFSFALLCAILTTGCPGSKDDGGSGDSGYYPEQAVNTRLLSHFNKYASAGYSNCWGYTAPNGKEYAILGARSGTSIVDITDGTNPLEVAFISGRYSNWRELKVYGSYAYVVTEAGGGMQIIDLSNLPISASLVNTYTGFDRAHTISIDEARGILYTGGGEARSTRSFDLSDPVNPAPIGTFNAPRYVHDQTMIGTFGYLAEGSDGTFSIFDLTNVNAPALVQRWLNNGVGVADPGHDHGSGGGTYAHNIWPTADGKAVITTEETHGKTVKRWNIEHSDHVHLTGEYLGPNGLAHNAHVKGRYAYVAHYGAGMRILDLNEPDQLTEVGVYQKAGTMNGGFTGVWGLYPYFKTGKIILSDIEDGLYVVYFEGAVEITAQ